MKPLLISICRSVKSGYIPKKYSEFTEQTLINYLTKKQNRKINPNDITSPFEIYSFVTCKNNIIYNPLTDYLIKLNKDQNFAWNKMKRGSNFSEIFKAMKRNYDMKPEKIKKILIKFIFQLKMGLIIK